MTRVNGFATAWAAAQHVHPTQSWADLCQKFVRSSFDAPPGAPTAIAAWTAAGLKVRTTNYQSVPAAVPYYYAGGAQGHVVHAIGDGTCWTNDFVRPGKIDRVRLVDIVNGWGMAPLGWTQDINGVTIYPYVHLPPPVQQPPASGATPPQETDVLIVYTKQSESGLASAPRWANAGAARRQMTPAEFHGLGAAGITVKIVVLPDSDPYWRLPVVPA